MRHRFELELTEKEFQDIVSTWMIRAHSQTRVEILRETYVNGSVADFVVLSPYKKGVLYVYELKMYYDNDRARLDRQLKNYLEVADYVFVIVFGDTIDNLPENVNQIQVNIKNGVFDYRYIGNNRFRKNQTEKDWKRRLNTIKNIRSAWATKVFYADQVIGYTQRKIERIKKSSTKGDSKSE